MLEIVHNKPLSALTTFEIGGPAKHYVEVKTEEEIHDALGWARELWPVAFFALSGALLTSYNKARVAIEMPIDNMAWPDLVERLERIVILIAVLLAEGLFAPPASWPWSILASGLFVLGALSHATAVQRFLRARKRLAP